MNVQSAADVVPELEVIDCSMSEASEEKHDRLSERCARVSSSRKTKEMPGNIREGNRAKPGFEVGYR